MKTLKAWLDDERGRYTALAARLGVSVGRVSQMADHGVPPKFMLTVRDFTEGDVSLEALVAARTPDSDDGDADESAERAHASTKPQGRSNPDRSNTSSERR